MTLFVKAQTGDYCVVGDKSDPGFGAYLTRDQASPVVRSQDKALAAGLEAENLDAAPDWKELIDRRFKDEADAANASTTGEAHQEAERQ